MKHRQRRSSILLGERHTTLLGRLVGKTIDMVLVAAVYFLGQALWEPLGVIVAVMLCGVHDALAGGQSVGKRIMGLRVTEDRTGQPCGYRTSVLRNLPFVLLVACASTPFLWALAALVAAPLVGFETFVLVSLESGIRLGDVMANTVVVEYDRPSVFEVAT